MLVLKLSAPVIPTTQERKSTVPAADSLRACGPAIDPDPHLLCGFLSRKRWQGPAVAGVPSPSDQTIVGDVIVELFQSAVAVFFGIFDLTAEIGGGAPNENHFLSRIGERPPGVSRRHMIAG